MTKVLEQHCYNVHHIADYTEESLHKCSYACVFTMPTVCSTVAGIPVYKPDDDSADVQE